MNLVHICNVCIVQSKEFFVTTPIWSQVSEVTISEQMFDAIERAAQSYSVIIWSFD